MNICDVNAIDAVIFDIGYKPSEINKRVSKLRDCYNIIRI